MKKMNLNSGINPELIQLHFGPAFCFGINQALKKVTRTLKNDFCKKYYRIYIIKMDFVEINFEAIRPHIYLISPNQSIEDYKNVYKSVFESFDKFFQNKKNMI